MAFIEALIAAFILFFISNFINKYIPEHKRIPRDIHRWSSLLVVLIVFAIILGVRFLLETLGAYFSLFLLISNDALMFAVMVTIFYFIYIELVFRQERFGSTRMEISGNPFLRIFRYFIIICWIISVIFLSITLLQINMDNPDIFNLGFIWAALAICFDIIITFLINSNRSIDKRLPKQILYYAIFSGGLIAFGIWSLQLIIFELYLKRAIPRVILWTNLDTWEFLLLKIITYVILFVIGIFGIGLYAKKKKWNEPYVFAFLTSLTWFMVNLYLGIGFYFLIGNYLEVDILILIINIPIELIIVKYLYNQTIIESLKITIIFNIVLFIVAIMPSFVDANKPIPEQDIRVLLGVVSGIYGSVFYISLKKVFLPKAEEKSKLRVQRAIEIIEVDSKTVQDFVSGGNHAILDVKDLTTYFHTEEGTVRAVEGVSFKVYEGETLGLVGETGCGKSVTALSILRVIRPPGKIEKGSVFFGGENLIIKPESEMLKYRGRDITMIFQDPLNSLNPVFRVGKQISEVFLLHMENEMLAEASKYPDKTIHGIAREWSIDLLRELNIPFPHVIIDRYPHELSGGMRQRVQIAMALACRPKLLIADEPTTALDVTIQNQILKLMKELRQKYNTTILFITHDLGIISKMCDRVAVMYCGAIVEYGNIKKLFTNPYHPYTRGLIASVPRMRKRQQELEVIPGMVPNLIYPPSGCRFHPRCRYCFEPCDSKIPIQVEVEPGYFVACHLFDPEYENLATISIKNVEDISE